MKFWGPPSTIERKETPEELIFHVEPQTYIGQCLLAGAALGTATGFWVGWGYGCIVGPFAALGLFYYGTLTRRAKILRVTRDFIEVSGAGSGRCVRLRWSQIIRLDYISGGEDSEGGLTAKTGRWSSEFLVHEVSNEQAREIIHAIYNRFPLVKMADEPPGIFENLFGRKTVDSHELSPKTETNL